MLILRKTAEMKHTENMIMHIEMQLGNIEEETINNFNRHVNWQIDN